MKRWRCPDCGAVHTARPSQYCPGVHYTRDQQKMSLVAKLTGNPFLKSIPRLVEIATEKGVFPPGSEVSMASIYRFLKLHKAKRQQAAEDRRKFEVQMSNDLW
jgi:putative transposase